MKKLVMVSLFGQHKWFILFRIESQQYDNEHQQQQTRLYYNFGKACSFLGHTYFKVLKN